MKKSKSLRSLALLFLAALLSTAHAQQTAQLVLKEIVHGKTEGKILPDKIDVNTNQGYFEITVPKSQNCSERFRFSYRFMQDMRVLEMSEDAEHNYAYEIKIEPLGKSCFAYDFYLFRNPTVRAATDAAGSFSALKNNKIKDGSWQYNPDVDFIGERSPQILTYPTSSSEPVGSYSGHFKTFKLNTNYLKSGKRNFTELYFMFNTSSELAGYVGYQISFVYELVEGGQAAADPCAIKAPDCSCCPGTMPVWNFKTGQGECLCPEGQVWDRVARKCTIARN